MQKRMPEQETKRSEERKEMVTSTTLQQLNEQTGAMKMSSLQEKTNYTSGQTNTDLNANFSSKMSKTINKNKMKLKLAAEIHYLKKD